MARHAIRPTKIKDNFFIFFLSFFGFAFLIPFFPWLKLSGAMRCADRRLPFALQKLCGPDAATVVATPRLGE
jgi:hypothetical protein